MILVSSLTIGKKGDSHFMGILGGSLEAMGDPVLNRRCGRGHALSVLINEGILSLLSLGEGQQKEKLTNTTQFLSSRRKDEKSQLHQ